MNALHRTRRRGRAAVLGVTLTALLLAGCATGAEDSGAGPQASGGTTTTPTTSPGVSMNPPTTGPAIPPPTGRQTPGQGEMILVGDVEMVEIEGGCLVLRVGSTMYQLFGGDPQVVRAGRRLQVRGRVRSDIVTICQVGPVLEVLEARPA